jgi:polar amino acid transport system ATP-binding protein
LTAVMGPSGAGLTSLLMCLNGMNNSELSRETEIRLSCVHKIRSTFIGHNEKEFVIMGLTAKQNMIYASKLKNSSHRECDHEMNVMSIMSDLMIADTMDTKAERCSGGEQKRLAIALELTAILKPNLILCDEPTTGLDSNVAEVVSHPIISLIFYYFLM